MGMFDFMDPLQLFGGGDSGGVPGLPGMGGSSGSQTSSGGFHGLPGMGGSSGGGGGGGMFAGLSGGGVLGALTGSEAIYGRKPNPVAAPTPSGIVSGAVNADLANMPGILNLAGQANTFNQDQLLAMLEKSAPGTGAAQAKYVGNISDALNARLPQDVVDRIKQQGAQWGQTSGTGGAQIGNWRDLRNLGLLSLQRQDTGGKQLESLLENTRKYTIPSLANPLAYSLKPSYDPYAEFQNALFNEKVAAAPVPAAAGAAASQQALLESLLSIYSGGGKSALTNPNTYTTNYGGVNTSVPSSYGGGGGYYPPNQGYDYTPPPVYGEPGGGGGGGALAGMFA